MKYQLRLLNGQFSKPSNSRPPEIDFSLLHHDLEESVIWNCCVKNKLFGNSWESSLKNTIYVKSNTFGNNCIISTVNEAFLYQAVLYQAAPTVPTAVPSSTNCTKQNSERSERMVAILLRKGVSLPDFDFFK